MLQIFVFNYNRNKHLLNLLNSIYRNFKLDYKCYIIDDSSNDELTKMIIEAYSNISNFEVFNPSLSISNYRVGNLYSNMNFVIDKLLLSTGYSLFIQDDLQVVYEVQKEIIESFIKILELNQSPFLNVMFSKFDNHKLFDTSKIEEGFYYKKLTLKGDLFRSFTDNFFCDNSRLLKSGFRVEMSETKSDQIARTLFGPLPFCKNPIMMFCIQPKYYRYPRLKMRIVHRYLDKVNGLYLFYLDLTHQDVIKLNNNYEIPFADNYLRYNEEYLKKPIKSPYRYKSTAPLTRFQSFLHYFDYFFHNITKKVK